MILFGLIMKTKFFEVVYVFIGVYLFSICRNRFKTHSKSIQQNTKINI